MFETRLKMLEYIRNGAVGELKRGNANAMTHAFAKAILAV